MRNNRPAASHEQHSDPCQALPPNACAATVSDGAMDALPYIELRVTEIETLINKGLLKWETRNDRNAIIDALYEFFDHTLNPMP